MFSHKELAKYAATTEVKRILSMVERMVEKEAGCVLAVTSAVPGEGKSLTAISLALSAIKDHRDCGKVLAMDLNWHNPSLHLPFGLELEEGREGETLTELVLPSGEERLDLLIPNKAVKRRAVDYDNSSAFAREMMEQAREEYAFTVLDTRSIFPPSREMRIDPVKICCDADFSLIVALAAVTPRQTVQRAVKLLQTDGVSNLGVTLNQWRNPIFAPEEMGQKRQVAA